MGTAIMMKTASASDLLDATIPPAIGVEIEEGCPQSLLEKRKHAETGDGSQQSQPPPTEKRNRGENEEQLLESLQPRGKQGGCKCKGGKNEGYNCKGGGEREQISFDELPPHAQLYFQKLKAIVGHEVRVGIPCADSDEEPIGEISSMIGDQNWPADDYGYCCSNPFEALDFKEDPKLYVELRVFGEKAVAYLKNQFNKTACFEDIERVESCPAPCKHHVVTIKARGPRGPCEEVWEIVLRGKVLRGFLEAKAHEFLMLECYRV